VEAFHTAFDCVCLLVAVGALGLLARFSIAQGRFDLDASTRAFNLSNAIDHKVEGRIANYSVRRPSGERVTADGRPLPPISEQPPDPNVRVSKVINDVHELEREAQRMTNSDLPSVRDGGDLPDQPLEV
jgi:hypothetical protein